MGNIVLSSVCRVFNTGHWMRVRGWQGSRGIGTPVSRWSRCEVAWPRLEQGLQRGGCETRERKMEDGCSRLGLSGSAGPDAVRRWRVGSVRVSVTPSSPARLVRGSEAHFLYFLNKGRKLGPYVS